jgi:hypothetical protein
VSEVCADGPARGGGWCGGPIYNPDQHHHVSERAGRSSVAVLDYWCTGRDGRQNVPMLGRTWPGLTPTWVGSSRLAPRPS